MLNNAQQKQAGQSIFLSSVTGLANTLAVVVTFFGAPTLYGKTVNFVHGFAAAQYAGWEDFACFAWFFICGLIVFFISRASISTALVVGGLAIATKLF